MLSRTVLLGAICIFLVFGCSTEEPTKADILAPVVLDTPDNFVQEALPEGLTITDDEGVVHSLSEVTFTTSGEEFVDGSDYIVLAPPRQAVSGSYIVLAPRQAVKGTYKGYKYEFEVALDKTGHNISGCPKFEGKRHLNIKVWKKKSSRGSWKKINDLHITVEKWCNVVIHDSRAKIYCEEQNYCMHFGRAVATAIEAYAVKQAVTAVITRYGYLILPI